MVHPPAAKGHPPNPLKYASLYSQLTFSWPLPLIRKGVAKEIQEDDIPEIMPDEDSDRNRCRIEAAWNEEKELAQKHGRAASLHRALLKLYFRTLWYVQPAIAMTSASRIGQAVTLGSLMDFFQGSIENQSKWEGYILVLILVFCASVPLITHHQTYFRAWRMGMQLRIGCIASIYHKSLKLSAAGIGKSSTAGEMSNLASNDVERFLYASLFISYLFWAPIEAISVLCVGVYQLGPAFAAGYVVLFTFVPLQFYLGHRFAIARSRVTCFTDERVNLVSQAVTGARVMKMSCWELEFVKRINDLRKDEIEVIRTASRYRALNEAIFFATSVSVAIVIFIVHVLSGNVLTPHNVFTTFALINLVQFTMTKFFAYAVMSCSECYVSVRRIQNFLELPEHTEHSLEAREGFIISVLKVTAYWNSDFNHPSPNEKERVPSLQRMKPKQFLMAKRNLVNNCHDNEKLPDSFKGPSQLAQDDEGIGRMIALENISFDLERGRLYCVIGPVGCGKSALLLALAGELEPAVGSITRHTKSVAYVAQSAWIMDGTLKENILMGNSFDQIRYNEVIDACGLRPDLKRFYSGDETLLGDRGIQCSGGQRARIGLARALYQDADLLLLDDPLSAVDSTVSRLIFESGIRELCLSRGKCVVLATHQYQLIENETCIVMNRGKIIQIDVYHNCCDLSREALKTGNIDVEASNHAFEGKVEKSYASNDSNENLRDNISSDSNKEEKSIGEVSGDTWYDYIHALGGRCVVAGLLLLFAFTQCALIMTIVTIGRWAEKSSELQSSLETFMLVLTFGVVVIFLSFWRSWLAFSLTLKASQKLHDAMTLALLRANIEFFDTNPLGRILNRFSADIGIMDDQLPVSLNDTVSIGFLIIGAIATAASVLPFILIAVPPIAYYFIRIRRMFMAASRELKRYEGMARSPLYAMMSETIMGITSIRVNGATEYFQDRFSQSQNAHSRAFFSYIACTRWLNFRLETIQLCLLSIASFLAVFFHTQNVFNVDPAVLGLSLSLLLQLSGLLQWAVRQSCDVISHMVAVERVASYGKVPSESPLKTEADDLLDETWPSEGSIEITNLSVRYQKQIPPSLSGLSFHSKGGARIGIVGRTGSGKSTFLHAFLRLLEAEEGKIAIDQEDVSKLGLHKIRKLISVIPQTPFLFSGWTLRDNLDPFKKHSDKEIMQSIINVQLENLLQECPHGLNAIVNDSGSNFSVGQRQLLCVARAILQNNRILFLDEATANVDPQTEDLLSAAVATSFPGATIISIAHRLETIIDYDLILVIEKGKIIESGSPSELLIREGNFAAMIKDTGPSVSASLRQRAQNASSTFG